MSACPCSFQVPRPPAGPCKASDFQELAWLHVWGTGGGGCVSIGNFPGSHPFVSQGRQRKVRLGPPLSSPRIVTKGVCTPSLPLFLRPQGICPRVHTGPAHSLTKGALCPGGSGLLGHPEVHLRQKEGGGVEPGPTWPAFRLPRGLKGEGQTVSVCFLVSRNFCGQMVGPVRDGRQGGAPAGNGAPEAPPDGAEARPGAGGRGLAPRQHRPLSEPRGASFHTAACESPSGFVKAIWTDYDRPHTLPLLPHKPIAFKFHLVLGPMETSRHQL